jgi:hypothetical protein
MPFIPTFSPTRPISFIPKFAPWTRTSDEVDCSICYDSLKGVSVQFTPCEHQQFCISCIRKWIPYEATKATCPLCRRQITKVKYNPLSEWNAFVGWVDEWAEQLVEPPKLSRKLGSAGLLRCAAMRSNLEMVKDQLRRPRLCLLVTINDLRAYKIEYLIHRIRKLIKTYRSYNERNILIITNYLRSFHTALVLSIRQDYY